MEKVLAHLRVAQEWEVLFLKQLLGLPEGSTNDDIRNHLQTKDESFSDFVLEELRRKEEQHDRERAAADKKEALLLELQIAETRTGKLRSVSSSLERLSVRSMSGE